MFLRSPNAKYSKFSNKSNFGFIFKKGRSRYPLPTSVRGGQDSPPPACHLTPRGGSEPPPCHPPQSQMASHLSLDAVRTARPDLVVAGVGGDGDHRVLAGGQVPELEELHGAGARQGLLRVEQHVGGGVHPHHEVRAVDAHRLRGKGGGLAGQGSMKGQVGGTPPNETVVRFG